MDPFVIGIGAVAALLVLGLLLLATIRSRGTNLDRRPYVVIGGFGSAAANMSIDMVRAMRDLGILFLILLVLPFDLNDTTYRRTLPRLVGNKKKLFLPTPNQRLTSGLRNDPALVRQLREFIRPIVSSVNDRIVMRAQALKLRDILTFWIMGWQGGHRFLSMDSLERRQNMLRLELKLPIIVIPDDPELRDRTVENARLAEEIVRVKKLAPTTLLIDNLSALMVSEEDETSEHEDTRGRGKKVVDRMVMVALASLTAGPQHFQGQRSTADALRDMGRYATMTGMSFGRHHLIEPEESRLGRFWRKLRGQRPDWSVENLEMAANLAIAEAMEIKPGNSTIDANPIPAEKASRYLIITVPLPLRDRRRWTFKDAIDNRLKSRNSEPDAPRLTIVWASGHGAPESGMEHLQYHVQATIWWGLEATDVPDPIRVLMGGLRRRRLLSETEVTVVPPAETSTEGVAK